MCGYLGLDNMVSIFKLDQEGAKFSSKDLYRELQQHEGYLSICQFVYCTNIMGDYSHERHIITSTQNPLYA